MTEDKKKIDQGNMLHEAVRRGDVSAIATLIAMGADVNAKDGYGNFTPLHVLATTDENSRDSEVFRLLINKKADVTAKDLRGATPLHIAAYLGQKRTARNLIDTLSNSITEDAEYILQKDERGFTAIDYATSQGHIETAKCLIEKGVGDRLYSTFEGVSE